MNEKNDVEAAPDSASAADSSESEGAVEAPEGEGVTEAPEGESVAEAPEGEGVGATGGEAESTPSPSDESIHVVAIGASAGGLDALEHLFHGLPEDSGAAFVVIQHLSPDHKSLMAGLLSRHTDMEVRTVEEGMVLVPNVIHLIPPGVMMHLEGRKLRLRPKVGSALHLPIDAFFTSMSGEVGARAVGVILSGTGSDGSEGASAVSAAGGLLIAQEPETAPFDGMPRSVIATGLVDAVLPVERMGARIVAHLSGKAHEPDADGSPGSFLQAEGLPSESVAAILELMHQRSAIDFGRYKPGTVHRRIDRRMVVRHATDLKSYLGLLQDDVQEQETLQRELLIPVTSFFRDPEAFEALRECVVDPLVRERRDQGPIRIWCAGAATGEEAYSLAMLFLDAFERHQRWPGLKVFATDVSAPCVETGAAGVYPAAAAEQIPAAFVERFFERKGDALLVRSELRQTIVFARHNLLADPPFTRMDLVACRNTLIYFNAEAQEHVLRKFQYSLRPERFLFLGTSEGVGSLQADFAPASARHRIWKVQRPASRSALLGYGIQREVAEYRRLPFRTPSTPQGAVAETPDRGHALLLKHYGPPPAIVVNRRHEIVHSYGDVRQMLTLRPGGASLFLTRFLPGPLAAVATALLYRAERSGSVQASGPVPFGSEEQPDARSVRIAVWPFEKTGDGNHLIVFEDVSPSKAADGLPGVDIPAVHAERLELLESELAITRETLQATIDALETSNEELQATNEELMASNEEFQSSNGELQSVNEELNTVNAEYQEKVGILNRVNADLDSLTQIVSSVAVFVDDEMCVTRFSPDAERIFRVRHQDIGRPLADLNHTLDYPALHEDLRRTLDRAELIETEVSGPVGRHYLVRMLPYRVPSSTRRGAVLSVIDITETRNAQRLQSILDGLAEHVAVLDADGRIRLVNEGWIRFAKENGDPELLRSGPGTSYLDACVADVGLPDAEYAERAAQGIQEVLQGRRSHFSMQYPCDAPHEKRWFVMHVRPLTDRFSGAVVSHIDISRWHESPESGDAS